MSQIVESACPLCHSAAKCEEHLMRRLKHFVCPVCKEIIIKNKAEQWLAGASEKARLYHSEAASKIEQGLVYFIARSPDAALPENPSVRGQSMKYEDAMKL
jgi:hypothetical protein